MADIAKAVQRVTSSGGFLGSAFPVQALRKRSWFVTCAHVVLGVDPNSLAVGGQSCTVDYRGDKGGFDLAILRVDKRLDLPVLPLQFPAGHPLDFTLRGWRRSSSSVSRPRLAKVTGALHLGDEFDEPSLPGSPRVPGLDLKLRQGQVGNGLSGSPILDDISQHVVGVFQDGSEKARTGTGISIEALSHILERSTDLVTLREKLPRFQRSTLRIAVVACPRDTESQDHIIGKERIGGYPRRTFGNYLRLYQEGLPWDVQWVPVGRALQESEVIVCILGPSLSEEEISRVGRLLQDHGQSEKKRLLLYLRIVDRQTAEGLPTERDRLFPPDGPPLCDIGAENRVPVFHKLLEEILAWWRRSFPGGDSRGSKPPSKYLQALRHASQSEPDFKTDFQQQACAKAKELTPDPSLRKEVCRLAQKMGAKRRGPFLTKQQLEEIDKKVLYKHRRHRKRKDGKKAGPDAAPARWILRCAGLHPQTRKRS